MGKVGVNMRKLYMIISAAMVLILALSGCSAADRTVITVNDDATVTSDVFSYFLKTAMTDNNNLTEDEYLDIATNECIKYIAVNTIFAQNGMTLTPAQKASLSDETNTLWRQYGAYYSLLGLTKETFYKIKTGEQYREAVRFALYDTDGSESIGEDIIKGVFNSEYCGFRFVCEYLYNTDDDGNTVKKSQSEIDATYNNYLSAATEINNNGSSLEEAYAKFATDEAYKSLSLDTVLIDRDSAFPDGFFDAVQKAEYNKAVVIIADDYLYLLIREDILSADYDFYEQYRDKCLVTATEGLLTDKITEWVGEYNAVRQIDTARRCYKSVLNADKKFSEKER